MAISKINTNSIAAGASPTMDDLTLTGSLFLGGTGAANELDDYEEGTFTPVFEGSTGNPTVSYGDQVGRYTKVGNKVYVEVRFSTTSVSGGSGILRIGGLPFTASNASNAAGCLAKGFVFNWATDPEVFVVFRNDAFITIYSNDSTNSGAVVSDLSTTAGTRNFTTISGFYTTDS